MNSNHYLVLALLVGLGGFIGSTLRFALSNSISSEKFPYGTLLVNIIGSFILGYLVFSLAFSGANAEEWKAFLGIGVLGAFTTMSTFSVETVTLFDKGESITAAANVLVGVGGCLLAVWAAKVVADWSIS